MEYKASSSTNKNSCARENASRGKGITIAKISIVVYMSFCLSCVTSKYQDKKGDSGILEMYLKKQRYGADSDGQALRVAEQKIVNKLGKEFDSAKSIIIIKEFCKPYNFSGFVYSGDIKKGRFFYQTQKFTELNFDGPSSVVEPIFYNRIIDLLKKDSLGYYREINKSDFPADDEFCWLYVIYVGYNSKIIIRKKDLYLIIHWH